MASGFDIGIFVTILMLVLVMAITLSSVRIINPWEQGLVIRFGSFIGILNPGIRFVAPLVTTVVRMDLRTAMQEIPAQEVSMKNGVAVTVDAILYYKIVDSKKAYFEVHNPRIAVTALAQVTMKAVFQELTAVEVALDRRSINMRLRDILDEATDPWGVKVEAIELRRFESGGKDLWRELAIPVPLIQIKLHARTPLEEAATFQVMAARSLLDKLKRDNEDADALKDPMEKAETALSSGNHLEALRLALHVTESGLGRL